MAQPTLVMVHGLIGSLDYFEPARRMSSIRVLTPDLLGYGVLSGVDRESLTLTDQVAFLIEYMERALAEPGWLLGHSMGGALVMMLADQRPDLVAGIINVEGNFTLRDAFWSRKIASLDVEDWRRRFIAMQSNPADWLSRNDIVVTPCRQRWAKLILENQSSETIHAMSCEIVARTATEGYRLAVNRVAGRVSPLHLIAGERSAGAWDVPVVVREAAQSYDVMADAGHMMMLEAPDEFCQLLSNIVVG